PDSIAGANLRHELNIDPDKKVILYVGRLTRKKGVHLILKSVEAVLQAQPKTVFVFVLGEMEKKFDAAYVNEMYDLWKSHPHRDRIYFCRNVPEDQLPAYYNMADVCVFPSIG